MLVKLGVALILVGIFLVGDPIQLGLPYMQDGGLTMTGVGVFLIILVVQRFIMRLVLAVLLLGVGAWLLMPVMGYDPAVVVNELLGRAAEHMADLPAPDGPGAPQPK